MSAHGSAATEDDSKPVAALSGVTGGLLGLLAPAALGAVLLCVAEATTVVELRVGDVVRVAESGADRHGWALLVLGVAALPLAWGAAVGRARPAAFALLAIGAAALVFFAVGDLPDTRATGELGIHYEDAHAAAGPGLWLELAGGLLLVAAAVAALTLPARARVRRP
jgi:hypothetical protein